MGLLMLLAEMRLILCGKVRLNGDMSSDMSIVRLGLLVKTAMLEWLAEADPAIEQIETANASANEHMIAVNDAIGFKVDPPDFHWVELAVADVLARD
jgi:hypothetical protein